MPRTYSKFTLAFLLSAVLAIGTQQSQATTTYIVGTCKAGTQFATIQSALNAKPAPTLVQVCPGNYPEQITITNPVTIQGVSAKNSAQVHLMTPPGGFKQNAFLGSTPAGVQIFVDQVTGEVNLSNLFVDATNNALGHAVVIGIYYEYSSGTVNHVAVFNQQTPTGGYGVYLLGGHSNQSVTVENSVISYVHPSALVADNLQDGTELNATIKNNYIHESDENILVKPGAKATITNNFLYGATTSISYQGAPGSIANNTIVGEFKGPGSNESGIGINSNGVSVKSNKIYAMPVDGIVVSHGITVGPIQGNLLVNSQTHGINLNCASTGTPNQVYSNTFLDVSNAFGNPLVGALSGTNTFNVVTEEVGVPCS